MAHFLAHADRALPSVVAPILKARFDLSDTALGLLLGPVFGLAFVAGSLLAGLWADRAPRWRLIGWGVLVWTLASVLTATASGFEGLAAARAGMAVGQAVLAPAALSLLLQDAPAISNGRRIGAFTSGAAIGRSAALLLGGGLLAALAALGLAGGDNGSAWRWLFVVSAAPNLLLAALLLIRRESVPTVQRDPVSHRAALAWAREHGPALTASLAVASACIVLTQALGQWAPSLFNRVGGLDAAGAATAAGIVVLCAAPVAALLGGGLVDLARQKGPAAPGVLAGLLLLASPAAVGLALADDLIGLSVAFFLATVSIGSAAVAALASWQALTPQPLRGRGSALYFAVVTAIGLGLGPPLVGLASDLLVGQARLGAGMALVIVCVSLPAALLSLTTMRGWRTTADAARHRHS